MDRSLGDLQDEASKLGLSTLGLSKNALENALRDFYWDRDHLGETMLFQADPMLAEKFRKLDEERQAEIWKSPKWVAQLKLNGCRLILHIGGVNGQEKINRLTARGKSVTDFLFGENTDNFPYHRDLDLNVLQGTVLDGEIISPYAVVNTGRTVTRKALQVAVACTNPNSTVGVEIQKKYGPMQYHVFDIIKYIGKDVTGEPYAQRLHWLNQVKQIVERLGAQDLIKFVPVVKDDKEAYYNKVVAEGEEGVVLKDITATYRMGARPTTLLKVKRFEELDAYVVGFVPGKEGKALENVVGGLLFAVNDAATGKQTLIGCISGLPMDFRKAATVPAEPIAVPADKEFVYTPEGKVLARKPGSRIIRYRLNPEFLGKVAVIRGQEFTPRKYRFAHCVFTTAYLLDGQFNPWRTDKRPSECIEDLAEIAKKAGAEEVEEAVEA